MVKKNKPPITRFRKIFYLVGSIIVLIILSLLVFAYGGNNPSDVGHSSGEIEINDAMCNIITGHDCGYDDSGGGEGAAEGVDVYSCPVHADICYGRTRVMPGGCNGQLTTRTTCCHGECCNSNSPCTYVGKLADIVEGGGGGVTWDDIEGDCPCGICWEVSTYGANNYQNHCSSCPLASVPTACATCDGYECAYMCTPDGMRRVSIQRRDTCPSL